MALSEWKARIGSKGRVTIPLRMRQYLRLRPGDTLTFVLEDDYAILKPALNAVEATAGILRRPGPPLTATEMREATEEAIAQDRGEE